MHTLRVLVVDDEFGMRAGVERVLRGLTIDVPEVEGSVRFAVEQAETGRAAMEIISKGEPDLMLLDHQLPDTTGMNILDQLDAAKKSRMMVIMITAYASIETALAAAKRGAYDFLAKPFTPEELVGAVRKAASHLILQQQARRLAEEKRQVRFQFISVLAHELKAPLNAIEGYLRLMQERTVGERMADYDNMVGRSLMRIEGMRKLIFDLLDMTRIESGQKQRRFEEIDLRALAAEAIEAQMIGSADKRIGVALQPGKPVRVTADRDELNIVLSNLISNAIKYNRPDGTVSVSVGRDGGAVVIEVADTGIGMAAEETARLFGDFVRIKNEKTRDISGSGLGLSTVKKIAALYGGDVQVASEPDVGTTFRFVFNPQAG